MPPAISQKGDQGGNELHPSISLIAPATTKTRLRWMVYVEGVFRYRGLNQLDRMP